MNGTELAVLWDEAPAAERRALLYGVLAAAGWAYESQAVMAVGLGGLVAALVEMWSDAPRRTTGCIGGTDSRRNCACS